MDALTKLINLAKVPKWQQEALKLGIVIDPNELPEHIRDRVVSIIPPRTRHLSYKNTALIRFKSPQGQEVTVPLLNLYGALAFPDMDPFRTTFIWRDRNWKNVTLENVGFETSRGAKPGPKPAGEGSWRERNRERLREYARRYAERKRTIKRLIGDGGTPEQRFEGDDQSEFDKLIAELQAGPSRPKAPEEPEADPLDSPLSSLHAERATRDEAPIE